MLRVLSSHRPVWGKVCGTVCGAVSSIASLSLLFPLPPTLAQDQPPQAILRPGENLVVEGLPPVPQTLVESVSHYTNFRSATLASWHPTRREMLISTRFGDVPQIHWVRSPLGMRKQLTFFSERVSGATFQPTQGDYFIFSRDMGGNEFNQNYRYDWKTGDITLLTDGKSKNSRGIWGHQGDRMVYTSTRRNGKDVDLYMIEPKTGRDRLLTQVEGGGWGPLAWSPDDRQILMLEFISVNESYLWLVAAETGEKTLLTPKGGAPIAYQGAQFSKDGKGLYVVSDRGSEFSKLVYFDLTRLGQTGSTASAIGSGTQPVDLRQVDLTQMEPKVLTSRIPWDVEEFDLSEDGKHLAFITNEDGLSVLRVIETATGKEKKLPKLPVGIVWGLSWHRNGEDLGFTFTSARNNADIYSINLRTQTLERWTESETGGLNVENFANAELVRWKSFDGRMISGFLYRPPANKFKGKRPVIVDIHGGPEAQSQPFFLGRMNYYLNELGVAILFPNVRGSSGYGKTFLTLDNGFKREDSVKDIGAALDWIAQQKDLNKDRVLVTGGSYGGYMSLAVAVRYSDRIRAAINIVGISNFVSFLERTEGYRRDLRRVEYGDERDPKMREFLMKISPLTSADRIKDPLFVIHGQNDPRVPLNEAEQIVRTVKKNRVPVWYLMAKDEGHGFSKKRNVDYQFYTTILFIQEFLLK
ncbi:MAG: S9 family peptidase [Synechococcales bacterium]|nr:S9 family peptidase [Synechococcales bacterium]